MSKKGKIILKIEIRTILIIKLKMLMVIMMTTRTTVIVMVNILMVLRDNRYISK